MKKLFFLLVLAFALLQFFRIDKTNPPVDKNMDFLTIKKTPENVATLIKSSCYDCHSNETIYPWYSNIQPFGWFLKDHIDEGRRELNFSNFATYEPAREARKLKKAASEIKEGEMPLESYLLIHKDAKLTPQQKELLVTYFNTMKDVTMITNKISEEELKPKKPNP